MAVATAAPAASLTGSEAAVMAALETMVGFAASPVLTARLRRAAHLLAACDPARADPDEPGWAALLDAVTVQETRLFRHPGQCATTAAGLPAGLAAARAADRPFRILSAGCATGEEAFTLAALALAAMEEVPGVTIEILGLDLCRPALASAAAGIVAPGLGDPLALVPPALRCWFEGSDGAPRLHPSLRSVLRFRRANLLGWEHGLFDVVFCRNVLIYLTDTARATVVANLRGALRPNGTLALGPSDRAPMDLTPQGESVWLAPHA